VLNEGLGKYTLIPFALTGTNFYGSALNLPNRRGFGKGTGEMESGIP
jgi:hypothetical protein